MGSKQEESMTGKVPEAMIMSAAEYRAIWESLLPLIRMLLVSGCLFRWMEEV